MSNNDLQTDLDDARDGWAAAAEEVRDLDEAIRRKDALLREALDSMSRINAHNSDCDCTICRIQRELGETR